MKLDDATVTAVADLARLNLTSVEIPRYGEQLSAILSLMSSLSAIDTNGIEPLAHPQQLAQPLRADTISETDQHALFQQGAPEVYQDLYLVPPVIEV